MGKTRVKKYGVEILEVIKAYCDENNVETSTEQEIFDAPKPKKEKR